MTPQKGWVVDEVFSQKRNLAASAFEKDSADMPVDLAPTLQALRSKFAKGADGLGMSDSAADTVRLGKMTRNIDVVMVKPERGGASKVAFRDKDGNIEIIQG